MEEAKWYVAHTFSGYENKVATDLKNKVENLNLTTLGISFVTQEAVQAS